MLPPVVGWEELPQLPPQDPERGPKAVAPAVVFLASDESRLCNGTELVLDDAQTAGRSFELPNKLYGPNTT